MTVTPPPLPNTFSETLPAPVVASDRIFLKLRRSQRTGLLGGKPIFILDARVDVPPEATALIRKHQLGGLVVYDSKARKENAEAAYDHFTEASMPVGLGRSLWKNARGMASAAMMALSLRVTVDKLIGGQHIECKDLDELLGAEAAVIEACRNLRGYIDTAQTFDGREELLEF